MLKRSYDGSITGRFVPATPGRKDVVQFAIQAFGYLIPRGTSVTMSEFADLIERHYDCVGNLRNAATARAVRECAEPAECV